MKIYTGTGDDGFTSTFGGGRVKKSNPRIEANGCVDELNAVLGIARSLSSHKEISEILLEIQNKLFVLGADISTPVESKDLRSKIKTITQDDVRAVEKTIDEIDSQLEPLKSFILPGGTLLASVLHFARTVCRRAERAIVYLSEVEKINSNLIPFINRLSDLLFVLARYANHLENVQDVKWQK